MPGLGRRRAVDPRDAAYPLRAVPRIAIPRTYRYYRLGPILDQGQQPMCVGYSWRQWIASAPIMERKGPAPDEIYHAAQELDEWPGTDYEGTSVRAGAKFLQTAGLIESYHWAQSIQELIDWILHGGTATIGSDFFSDMFNPTPEGFVKVSGDLVGGHAYLCCGYSQRRGAFKYCNSWGEGWGLRGRFWMSAEDAEKLLLQDGEAVAAIEKRLP